MKVQRRMWVALGALALLHCGPNGTPDDGDVAFGLAAVWMPLHVGDAQVATAGNTVWVAQRFHGLECWDVSQAVPVYRGTLHEAGLPEALGTVGDVAVLSVTDPKRPGGGGRTLVTASCDATAGPAVLDRWAMTEGGRGQVVFTRDSVQVLDPVAGLVRAGVDAGGQLVARFQSEAWSVPAPVLFADHVVLNAGAIQVMRLDTDATGFLADWSVSVPFPATAWMDGNTLVVVSGGELRTYELVRGEPARLLGSVVLGGGAELTDAVPGVPGVVVVATAAASRVVDLTNPSAPRVLLDAPVITHVVRNGDVLLVVGSAGRVHLVDLETGAVQDGSATPAGWSALWAAPLGTRGFLLANDQQGWMVRWAAEGTLAQVTDAPPAVALGRGVATDDGRVALVTLPNVMLVAGDAMGARVDGASSRVAAVDAVPLAGGARAWLEVEDGVRTVLVTSTGAREAMEGASWMRLFHHNGRLAVLVTTAADLPPAVHVFAWDGQGLTRVGSPLELPFAVREETVVQADGRLALVFGRWANGPGWCGPCADCLGALALGQLRVVDFASPQGATVAGDVDLSAASGALPAGSDPGVLRAAGGRVLLATFDTVADVDVGATPPTLTRTFRTDAWVRDVDVARMTAVLGDGTQCTWGHLEGSGFRAVFATPGQRPGACVLGAGDSVLSVDETGQWWQTRPVDGSVTEEVLTLRTDASVRYVQQVAPGTLLVAEDTTTRLLRFSEDGAVRMLWEGGAPWPAVRGVARANGILLVTPGGLLELE